MNEVEAALKSLKKLTALAKCKMELLETICGVKSVRYNSNNVKVKSYINTQEAKYLDMIELKEKLVQDLKNIEINRLIAMKYVDKLDDSTEMKIIYYYYFMDIPMTQIAKELYISVPSVYRKYSKALEKLRMM